jgi:hypothetical protein
MNETLKNVMITDVPADIRTKDSPNEYPYLNSL